MPGILMSIRTRSGASSATRSNPSSPVSASPTIVKPSTRRSTPRAAMRNGRESSTTRTRTSAATLATLTCREVDEHGRDAPVQVLLLGQPQLGEDGVGVLLHRALGQYE